MQELRCPYCGLKNKVDVSGNDNGLETCKHCDREYDWRIETYQLED